MFPIETLASSSLRAAFIPALGGKLASLRFLPKDFELMFQPKVPYRAPRPGARFADYDASGFDDAFPGIDAEPAVETPLGPIDYPDHGEVWSTPMRAERAPGALRLWFDSAILPYRYEKICRVDGDTLLLDYRIANTGGAPFPAIWTAHGLMNIEPGMRFLLPGGLDRALNLFDSPIGPKGVLPFPRGLGTPLDRPVGARQPSAVKYYLLGRVPRGECGAEYPRSGVVFRMRYDAETLPYLGVWITEGGFRGDHNFALEPSTGFYDGVRAARANGALPMLAPGETLAFTLELALCAMR